MPSVDVYAAVNGTNAAKHPYVTKAPYKPSLNTAPTSLNFSAPTLTLTLFCTPYATMEHNR